MYEFDRIEKLKYAYVMSVSFDQCLKAYICSHFVWIGNAQKFIEIIQPFCYVLKWPHCQNLDVILQHSLHTYSRHQYTFGPDAIYKRLSNISSDKNAFD